MLRTALTGHRNTRPSIHLILLCLLCEQEPGPLPLHSEGGHHQPLVPVVHQLGLGLTSLQGASGSFGGNTKFSLYLTSVSFLLFFVVTFFLGVLQCTKL